MDLEESAITGSQKSENAPANPVSEYGRSCLIKEKEAQRICDRRGLNLVTVRPFNIIGPGQEPVMMVSEFARDLASAEKFGTPSVIETGPLCTRRDYVAVRDVAGFIARVAASSGGSRLKDVADYWRARI